MQLLNWVAWFSILDGSQHRHFSGLRWKENQFSTFLLYRFFKSASTGNDFLWIRPIPCISDYFFKIYFFLLLSLFLSQLLFQSFELLKIASKIFTNIKYPITKCMESVVRYCLSKPSFKWISIAVCWTIKKIGQKLFLKKVDIFMICYRFLLL